MTNQEIYSEAPTYFHYYYGLIPSNDLLVALEEDLNATLDILKSIPSEKENFVYATLGNDDILRGYPKNRFRDKHFMGAHVE